MGMLRRSTGRARIVGAVLAPCLIRLADRSRSLVRGRAPFCMAIDTAKGERPAAARRVQRLAMLAAATLGRLRRPVVRCSPAHRVSPLTGGDESMDKSGASQGQSASELISMRIAELGDWRGETLSLMRELIKEADPAAVE